jgi:hypothetical protein
MADRKPTDWDAIEREYRAGQISVRAIASAYSITEGAIRKKAKAEGWQRLLADKVRSAVREKLVRDGTHPEHADDEEQIVDGASSIGVEVVLSHRRDIGQLRGIASILATRLAEYLQGGEPDGKFIGEKESVGDLLEKLTRVRSKLIPLERQAFNLDEDGLGDDPATKRDVALAARKLSEDQREQLRSIVAAVAAEPGTDAKGT